MSSRFRSESVALAVVLVLLAGGCERERREYYSAPSRAPADSPRLTDLQPGVSTAETPDPIGAHYEANAFHVGQGAHLFRWFNCNGCHANGGGGIGPALMDDTWRYGGRIDQIHASILQGRPNGMPAWRGKMTDVQAWQLAAYVRALSGNVRKDVAPSRADTLPTTPPLTQLPDQVPEGGDSSSVQAPGR